MKLLQTCWFNNPQKLDAGWLSTKYHLMSWGLSALSYSKFYPQIELITDAIGQELLIEKLALPYHSVSLAQEDYKPEFEKLWVLRKLYSYAIQDAPFIHADGDTYLFKPFDDEIMNAPLLGQNMEYDHPCYVAGYAEVLEKCKHIPEYVTKDENNTLSAANAGIMGGIDYDFYKYLFKEVNDFVNQNRNYIEDLEGFTFNIFLEQFIFKKLADRSNLRIAYQVKEPIGYPYVYNLFDFWSLPNNSAYIHVMNYKRNPTICEQIAQRLYIESPELYERIIAVSNKLEATTISTFIGNDTETLDSQFYRTTLISQHLGLVLTNVESIDSFSEKISTLSENPQNAVLKDAFQYELEKYQFIQSLPTVDDYVQYRKQQSLEVNEILSKSDEEILLSSVTFGEYVTQIESEWKWAEKNEFTGQDNAVDYRLNLQQEPSYFQVVLFCYPVSMTVKEQLSDTFTIMIIDVLQQIESNTLTIQEVLENVSKEIYTLNQINPLEELKITILKKIRYLLYQGVLAF